MDRKFNPSRSLELGPGAEFELVRRMLSRWGPLARGIGDDAVILRPPANEQLVVSTDSSVEGTHFKREWLSFAEIGYRATAAALSDLAAMGAAPLGVLVALTLPPRDAGGAAIDALADGIGECVKDAGTCIVGGDLSRGTALSLTITVLGSAAHPLRRNAAQPGDRVYLTGRLGGSRTALTSLMESSEVDADARARFARPAPRIREAQWLARSGGGARAAIDISDGLVADLRHVAAASDVEILVEAERIPLFGASTIENALESGEEYELAVTCRDELDVAAFKREFALELTEIGKVGRGATADVVVTHGHRRIDVGGGFDHFGG